MFLRREKREERRAFICKSTPYDKKIDTFKINKQFKFKNFKQNKFFIKFDLLSP